MQNIEMHRIEHISDKTIKGIQRLSQLYDPQDISQVMMRYNKKRNDLTGNRDEYTGYRIYH